MRELTPQEIAGFFQDQLKSSSYSVYTLVIESVRDSHANIEHQIGRYLSDITPALDSIITSTKDLKCLCAKHKLISFVVELDMRLDFLTDLRSAWLDFKEVKLRYSDAKSESMSQHFLCKYNGGKYEIWTSQFETLIKRFDDKSAALLCLDMLNKVIE